MQNEPTNSHHKNICGPFDLEFRKKFLGRQTHSNSSERLKLYKTPSLNSQRNAKGVSADGNILPKLKEIEKIAKTERRKPPKINKYLDGVSDLDVYIAKKLMNNLSTREIISKIDKINENALHNRKVVTDNYMRMTVAPSRLKNNL